MRNLSTTLGASALCLLAIAAKTATAQIYDVTTDWSNTNNSNGAWSYREGGNLLPSVASWQSTLGGWNTAQPGWAKSENGTDRLPFWFKSNGSENFAHDFLAGDVVVHSTDSTNGAGSGVANLLWTSSITGTINITGDVWRGRSIGRGNSWDILLNSATLTSGSLIDGDSHNRANPYLFSAGMNGGSVLNNIAVKPGDTIQLRITDTTTFGDFVGVQMRIAATPSLAAPEVSSLALLVTALPVVGLIAVRSRRS